MLEEINMDGVGETMNRLTEEEAIQLNALLDKIR